MRNNIIIIAMLFLSINIYCDELVTGVEPLATKYVFGFQEGTFNKKYLNVSDHNQKLSRLSLNFEEIKKYPLTPGDLFTLTIVSSSNYSNNNVSSSEANYKIQLKQDYTLNLPLIGDINAKDKNIIELENIISTRIKKVMPVQFINFSLTEPAIFDVFIYGGVNIPGSIQATPITTLAEAISARGGFTPNASYRDIHIKRDNKILHIDISKYYNEADHTSNPKLKPGDEVYVSMAQKMVSISGIIQFPGKYELLEGENLDILLKFCGGVSIKSEKQPIEISRIEKEGENVKISADIDLASEFSLKNGDSIKVLPSSQSIDTITIEGALYGERMQISEPFSAPTSSIKLEVPYYNGISLLKVLDALGGPTPYAKTGSTKIFRKNQKESISIDIGPLWKTRDLKFDVELKKGDIVLVPIEENFVAAFGALIDDEESNVLPHRTGYTVMDYLVRCGGIDYQIADTNNIQLVAKDGSRKKIKLTDSVPPGSIIYVSKNVLQNTNDIWNNVLIITGIVTSITAFTTTILTFINTIQSFQGSENSDSSKAGFSLSF